jgi:ParB-like chromosome segregation protein Spo0J
MSTDPSDRNGEPVRLPGLTAQQLTSMTADHIPVATLLAGDSPRLQGESNEHIRMLAATDAQLPPILVHRPTMQVVDGMHRLRAALLRGQPTIAVRFLDGSAEDAFISAVQANIEHGLPLTLADREAAAGRIIATHPWRSDRWIATVTGLAASTVATIRRRAGPDASQSVARIGRDGRSRPLSSAEGRRMASEVIAKHPDASIRKIAKLAGISPATALDVRDRMRRGEDPVPPAQRRGHRGSRQAADHPASAPRHDGSTQDRVQDRASLLRRLRNDPSLRFSESGRLLLRWLGAWSRGPGNPQDLVRSAPPHCTYLVAKLARSYAEEWLDLATELEQRVHDRE